ncbi:MAG: TSUP family transporter [Pseudomonadota bacterium]
MRDGRMAWPLARLTILGTLPGVVAGFYLRTLVLPDAARFKIFVGTVMLYLAWRLLSAFAPWAKRRPAPAFAAADSLQLARSDWQRMEFTLGAHACGFSVPAVLALSFIVGIIGGTYGIGGGAIVYSVLPLPGGGYAAPDWLLGSLFGLGGLAGMYLGAATQKHVPQNALKFGLAFCCAAWASCICFRNLAAPLANVNPLTRNRNPAAIII